MERTDPGDARRADHWWFSLEPARRVQIRRWIDGRSNRAERPLPGQTDIVELIEHLEKGHAQ